MPNFCHNTLTISGEAEAVAESLKYILNDEGEVDFNLAKPMPEVMYKNDVGRSEDMKELTEVPSEFYDIVPLSDLDSILSHLLETIDKHSKEYRQLSFTRPTVNKMMVTTLRELESEAPWMDLKKNIVENINDGVQYVNKYKAILNRNHRKGLANLIDIYYHVYIAPYCLSEYGQTDWYSWSVENWGTKWNAIGIDIENDENVFTFDTAWSPPDHWFDALNDKLKDKGIYVNILLQYGELGMMFGGELLHTADGEYADVIYDEAKIYEFVGYDPEEKEELLSSLTGPIEQLVIQETKPIKTSNPSDEDDDSDDKEYRPAA